MQTAAVQLPSSTTYRTVQLLFVVESRVEMMGGSETNPPFHKEESSVKKWGRIETKHPKPPSFVNRIIVRHRTVSFVFMEYLYEEVLITTTVHSLVPIHPSTRHERDTQQQTSYSTHSRRDSFCSFRLRLSLSHTHTHILWRVSRYFVVGVLRFATSTQ